MKSIKTNEITLSDCSVRIGERCLLGPLNLAVPKLHQRTVILGFNGSGKTLFLKLISGIISPSQGAMDWAQARIKKSFIFQSPILLNRTVAKNMAFVLPAEEKDATCIDEALDQVGMLEYKDAQALSLSLGQQQKVCIARALAQKPDVIIMDEPMASLDPSSTAQMESMIVKMKTRVIMSCHNLTQAKRIAEDIVYLEQGDAEYFSDVKGFFANGRVKKGFLAFH